MCERPLPFTAGPRRRHARPRTVPGDRMGTHTYMPSIVGLRRCNARPDGCRGGHSGHNRRMWYIVSAHGATGRGLPGCERHDLTHVTKLMTDGGKNRTGARGTRLRSETQTLDCGPYNGMLSVTQEGQEWKVKRFKKNTNTEQVLPK